MKIKHVFMTLGLAAVLGLGVVAGLTVGQAKEAKAYGTGDTTWYLAGKFNSWNLHDENYHLSYNGTDGEGFWEFKSDYAVPISEGDNFKVVYSWYDEGESTYKANYFGDGYASLNLQNNTDFTGGGTKDVVAANDMNVIFYFKMKSDDQNWVKLYWSILTDNDAALYNWCVDFLGATDSICASDGGENANHATALSNIWEAQGTAFAALPDKSHFLGTSGYEVVADAYNRYVHIMGRYGKDSGTTARVLDGFSGGPELALKTTPIQLSKDNTLTIAIVAVSAISLLAIGGFFFIRKRKEER